MAKTRDLAQECSGPGYEYLGHMKDPEILRKGHNTDDIKGRIMDAAFGREAKAKPRDYSGPAQGSDANDLAILEAKRKKAQAATESYEAQSSPSPAPSPTRTPPAAE
jgi:hypothetical protein